MRVVVPHLLCISLSLSDYLTLTIYKISFKLEIWQLSPWQVKAGSCLGQNVGHGKFDLPGTTWRRPNSTSWLGCRTCPPCLICRYRHYSYTAGWRRAAGPSSWSPCRAGLGNSPATANTLPNTCPTNPNELVLFVYNSEQQVPTTNNTNTMTSTRKSAVTA